MAIINKIRLVKLLKEGSRIEYVAEGVKKITEEDAQILQRDAGYHPAGYGLYDFKVKLDNGIYFASWNSQSSCD